MPETIVCVENLSKKYLIPHGPAKRSDTLRDALMNALRSFRRRLRHPLTSSNGSSRDFWALRDVSFQVKRGEVVGIIGRNGAGKSTLLKILSRITEPTNGRVTLVGRVASLLEVGTGFHPELSGRENIYLNGAILGMTRTEIRRKYDEIVEFAEVQSFLGMPVKHYSSGMYMRLAFAVAAHLEPEILVVDEVLAVGDTTFQKKCLGKLEDIGRQGRTVLIVSHNIPLIVNLCKRALLLRSGTISAEGTPMEVADKYVNHEIVAGGNKVWPDPDTAPGTDVVRLHSVQVFQDDIYGPTANVNIAKDVRVQISYWNLKEGESLYAGLWIKSIGGVHVLSTSTAKGVSLTEDSWCGRSYPMGLFRSECVIPGNFFNEGRYTISPFLGKDPLITQVLEEDLLTIDVYDSGVMRKEFYGGWLGVVRPRLAWQTRYDESTSLCKMKD